MADRPRYRYGVQKVVYIEEGRDIRQDFSDLAEDISTTSEKNRILF